MSVGDSTTPVSQSKPIKPSPDFPLFPHATGRWAKKIRGKLHYFGRWSDPDAALARYLEEKDDLHAGRVPRDAADALTVYTLCGKFLTAKLAQRDCGELSPRRSVEYSAACKLLIKTFGKARPVSDLGPDDFARLRAAMAKKWGPVRLKAEIIRTRSPFNWAAKNSLLARPVVFGEGFKVPSAKTLRSHRAAQGPKMIEAV